MTHGLLICTACGSDAGAQEHHFVPHAHDDAESPTVWLCHVCNELVHEREFSPRHRELTTTGLAAAKAQGRKLGGPRPGPKIRHEHGLAARIANADAFAAKVLPYIRPLRDQGKSLRTIAAELTARGIRTRRGCTWAAAAVNAVLVRATAA